MKLKVGDTVRCVDPKRHRHTFLTLGKLYTVREANDRCVSVCNDYGDIYPYEAGCFELEVNPAPTPSSMYYRNDSAARKGMPIYRGCLRYFPAALALVSILSRKGNEKHNPGEEMHHARGKSTDHGDCILRHQIQVGEIDAEMDLDHAVEVAWRALAQLQELAEKKYGWPTAPGARTPEEPPIR